MLTAEQCKAFAAQYQFLGQEAGISPQRAALLVNISRSWTALANQLARLAVLVKEESK
jgi:hypothetical protein